MLLFYGCHIPDCLPPAWQSTDLGKLAFLINQGDDVHWFDGNHVQRILVVGELDVLPVDVLQVIFLLLQLEDMADKELLEVLIGKVNAELFKAGEGKKKLWLNSFSW